MNFILNFTRNRVYANVYMIKIFLPWRPVEHRKVFTLFFKITDGRMPKTCSMSKNEAG